MNANDFDLRFPRPVNNSGSSNNIDSDGDGLIDNLDCASADNTSLYFPFPVTGASLQATPESITWDAQDTLTGTSTRYDIVKGNLSDLLTDGDFLLAFCLASGLAGTSFVECVGFANGRQAFFVVHGRKLALAGTFAR